MATQWNKGYNAIRRELKRDYEHIRDTWGDLTSDEMYDFSWKMLVKARQLPENDGAKMYVEKAYSLSHKKYSDEEYEEAKWVVV